MNFLSDCDSFGDDYAGPGHFRNSSCKIVLKKNVDIDLIACFLVFSGSNRCFLQIIKTA